MHDGKCGSGVLPMQVESWLVDAAPVSLITVSMNKDTGQQCQQCPCVSFIAFLK